MIDTIPTKHMFMTTFPNYAGETVGLLHFSKGKLRAFDHRSVQVLYFIKQKIQTLTSVM